MKQKSAEFLELGGTVYVEGPLETDVGSGLAAGGFDGHAVCAWSDAGSPAT